MDEQGVDRLFILPLSDFVAARNALARSLKTKGDKETAERIQKLPKPSISAWAINQLVRRDRSLLDSLLEALDRQRQLQLEGLGAGADRAGLKEAKQAENDAIGQIERALAPLLEEGGHASGRTAIERCVKSIRAAAVHADGRALLENGHLTIDFDTPGFEALGFGALADEEAETPKLRLVTPAFENKQREKEERLKELQRQRIEAQEKLDADQRRAEAERRRVTEEKRLTEERRKLDEQRRREELRRSAEEHEHKRKLAEEAKRAANERGGRREAPASGKRNEARAASEPTRLSEAKGAARLGEAAKILSSLRVEHARLEEQAIQLQDQVDRARTALERAERDAGRAKEELAQKAAQIVQLEQLLGLFDDEDSED